MHCWSIDFHMDIYFPYFIDSPATAYFKKVPTTLYGSKDLQTETNAADEEGCATDCWNSSTCSAYKLHSGLCELYFSGNEGGSQVTGVKMKKQPSLIQLHSGSY